MKNSFSDRPVLLITDEGGKMVRTPALTKKQNQKVTSATITIDESGNGQASMTTVYGGYFSERIDLVVLPMSLEDQKKWLYRNLDLPSFQVNSLKYHKSGEESPQITQTLDVTIRKKASVSGKRLFLQPNLLNQVTAVPDRMDDRRTDIVVRYNRVWSDTVEYAFPEKFHPEYIPDKVNIESVFGTYRTEINQQEGKLQYIRHLELNKGKYQPELYEAYRSFYEQMVKADKVKIVLKNTT